MIGLKVMCTALALMLFFGVLVKAGKREPVSPRAFVNTCLLLWFLSLVAIFVGLILAIWGV